MQMTLVDDGNAGSVGMEREPAKPAMKSSIGVQSPRGDWTFRRTGHGPRISTRRNARISTNDTTQWRCRCRPATAAREIEELAN